VGALERDLQLIGEAARRISLATSEANTAIPWKDIIGKRNTIANEYGEVDLDEIWKTMQQDVPASWQPWKSWSPLCRIRNDLNSMCR